MFRDEFARMSVVQRHDDYDVTTMTALVLHS